jgi:putative oxidoreductase
MALRFPMPSRLATRRWQPFAKEVLVNLVTAPYAILLLRLCLGAMFIARAMLKWRVFTIPGTVAFFKSLGRPGWLGYGTIAAELGGTACLILGIYPRYVALLLIPIIVGTIVIVHGKKGWLFSNADGGWEYPAGGGSFSRISSGRRRGHAGRLAASWVLTR